MDETIRLSPQQMKYLRRFARTDQELAAVIRTILERVEDSGIELSSAENDEEFVRLASQALRPRGRRERIVSARTSASTSRKREC